MKKEHRIPPLENFIYSTTAPQIAVLFTNPFDTSKVRLQLQQSQGIYKNSLHCLYLIWKHEGIRGLQKGLFPAILREGSKNVFRLGCYEPILNTIHTEKTSAPFWKRFLAGSASGVMGALACNPFEVIKTRLQSRAAKDIEIGVQHSYQNSFSYAVRYLLKTEGIMSLWQGAKISAFRSFLGTGANLASYTTLREKLIKSEKMKDGMLTDTVCAFMSSLVTGLVMNPTDVLRTRVYNEITNGKKFNNVTIREIVMKEGLSALYKGFFTGFMRLGPHFTLTFIIYEQMKRISLSYKNSQ